MTNLPRIRADDGNPLFRVLVEPQLRAWRADRGEWIVLPSGDSSDFLVVAADREGMRRAREIVNSFVGPGVATLSPEANPAVLETDEEHPVLSARLRSRQSQPLIDALERMILVCLSTPADLGGTPTSIGQLVRDLRLALSDQNAALAESLLSQIRESGRLSLQNLSFLQVELLGRLGRWRELRALPWFRQLVEIPKPTSVAEFLIEAVWWIDFVGTASDTPQLAISKFEGLPAYLNALFDAVDVPRVPGARRVAALRAIKQGSPDRFERVLRSASDGESEWLRGLSEPEADIVEATSIERARRFLSDGRFVDVVELALDESDDLQLLEVAVRAVAEIDDPELASTLRPHLTEERVATLPSTPGFRRALQRAIQLASDDCSSWEQWFERTARTEPWAGAAAVLRNEWRNWSIESLLMGGESSVCAEQLEIALDGPNAQSVEDVLDLLCELSSRLVVSPESGRFVDVVLYALLDGVPTEAVGLAFFSLAQAILQSNPSRARYDDLLEVCLGADQLFSSRALIPVALDLLDELAVCPSPDVDKRRAVAAVAFAAFRSHDSHGHFTLDDARLAQLLLDEMGLPTSELWAPQSIERIDEVDGDPWARLEGRTIVIYTLLEGLAQRFADRVATFCSTAQVVFRSDHVASDGLRSAVASADFVLVDTRHAKHPATEAIDQIVSRDDQLLPQGKGVSSFIRCLGERLGEVERIA